MSDPGLDRDLVRLLDAERARPPVEAELQARLLARVSAAVAAGAAAGAGAGAAAAGGSASHAAAASKPLLMALSTFLLGGALGAAVTWSLRPAPVERTVTVERRIEVPVPVTVVVSAPAAPPSTALAAPPTASAKPPSTADEDVAIQQIHSALGRGDTTAALASVAAHEKRFPNGQQADAREALAVQALVRAGRRDDAEARAARFRKRFPSSFYQSIVNQALATSK
ncbi:MAG: hypothetical protein HYV09_21330 [Deltaproteobacteria bacterium]|nr:hypothetical protein [Deltaproteobacteria bacterium]